MQKLDLFFAKIAFKFLCYIFYEVKMLNTISDSTLDLNLKNLALKEREILLHIAEIDRRKLYLSLAYPNLFDYLTKHIGYSNGSYPTDSI